MYLHTGGGFIVFVISDTFIKRVDNIIFVLTKDRVYVRINLEKIEKEVEPNGTDVRTPRITRERIMTI